MRYRMINPPDNPDFANLTSTYGGGGPLPKPTTSTSYGSSTVNLNPTSGTTTGGGSTTGINPQQGGGGTTSGGGTGGGSPTQTATPNSGNVTTGTNSSPTTTGGGTTSGGNTNTGGTPTTGGVMPPAPTPVIVNNGTGGGTPSVTVNNGTQGTGGITQTISDAGTKLVSGDNKPYAWLVIFGVFSVGSLFLLGSKAAA